MSPNQVRAAALIHRLRPPLEPARFALVRLRLGAVLLASFAFLLLTGGASCRAQTHEVVCSRGFGDFAAQFRTGVKVEVGPARNGQLATRTCEAIISWDKQKLAVASASFQTDVDAFGVDLGLGAPVVALQIKQTDADCCMVYRIYSLQKPVKLLRSITGGDFYRAADTDFDGRVEIWTCDAAAFDGFEGISAGALAPTVILRFESGELRDVSAEFQPYFDQEIARINSELDLQAVGDFRDGAPPADAALKTALKTKVLQIVSAYLYSGREEQAWLALARMWPASDLERMKTALLEARARGIRAQVQSVSSDISRVRRAREAVVESANRPGVAAVTRSTVQMINPRPIILRLHVAQGEENRIPQDSVLMVELVLDSAGKVRSAEPEGKDPVYNKIVKDSAADWKFIPALKDGQPVATRFSFGISLKR